MSEWLALGGEALATSVVYLHAATAHVRFTIAETITGPGGLFVLAAGLLGVAVLLFDGLTAMLRFARRRRARAGEAVIPRTVEARTLVRGGTETAEVARRTGLARDALTLIIAADPAEDADHPPHARPAHPPAARAAEAA